MSEEPFNGPNGWNWHVLQLSAIFALDEEFDTLYVVLSGTTTLWFNRTGPTTYAGTYNIMATVVHDVENAKYILTDATGKQTLFFDFTVAHHRGQLAGLRNANGETTVAEYEPGASGKLLSLSRNLNGKVTGFFYSYVSGAPLPGKLESVLLRVNNDDVRRASYTYYGSAESGGSEWDLKTAIVEHYDSAKSVWGPIARHYYRYYRTGTPPGFQHGLKYSVGSEAWSRMEAGGLSPLNATDAQIAQFADFYFEYDHAKRVVKESVSAGTYTHTFAYESNPDYWTTGGPWMIRTIETLTDSTQNIVYSDGLFQTVLRVYKSGADEWCWAWEIDVRGNYTLAANPSAVLSYDPESPQLFLLKDTNGFIQRWEYYYQDPEDPVPVPDNHLKKVMIQKGAGGTPQVLREREYSQQEAFGSLRWFLKEEKVYKDEAGTAFDQYSYVYTWYEDTFQMETRVTKLPAISISENGSGARNWRGEVFNTYGQTTWLRDERAIYTAFVNDPVNGALTRRIDDVNTELMPCPVDWEDPDPPKVGFNLITDYEYDLLGRRTAEYGPWHDVISDGLAKRVRRTGWIVYRDVDFETWTASGFVTGTGPNYSATVINPVRITRTDHGGNVTDEIEAIRTACGANREICCEAEPSVEACGQLDPVRDVFLQSSWSRWTSMAYDRAYRLAWQRIYFDIPVSGTGARNVNYGQSEFGYDSMGRRIRQVTPGGTITRTVFLPIGWDMQTWVGTDDAGATPDEPWGSGSNNMTHVAERHYDNNDDPGGDGNLTVVRLIVGLEDYRTTTLVYDWRNRRTRTLGEGGFNEFYTLNFRGRVTVVERRNGASTLHTLLSKTTTDYDSLDRIWQRTQFSVVTGVTGNGLSELLWYDPTGNVWCRRNLPGRSFEKFTFDGLGRIVRRAISCRETLPTYTQSGALTDDIVIEQVDVGYDNGGNLIRERVRERNHNATGNGPLNGIAGPQPAARSTTTCFWSDGKDRMVASANYGTNGGEEVERPLGIPRSTEMCLVLSMGFNARGEAFEFVDREGRIRRHAFDDAARLIKTVENCQLTDKPFNP